MNSKLEQTMNFMDRYKWDVVRKFPIKGESKHADGSIYNGPIRFIIYESGVIRYVVELDTGCITWIDNNHQNYTDDYSRVENDFILRGIKIK